MNACRKRLSLFALVVLLSGIRPAIASESVTLPFKVKGTPVSATPHPDGTVDLIGRGHATHLGRYTAFVLLTITPQGPTEPPRVDGIVTMVAANGDQLYLHHFGVLTKPFPNAEGEGSYEITGGTGRFEGASGQGAFSSHDNMTVYDGTIILSVGK